MSKDLEIKKLKKEIRYLRSIFKKIDQGCLTEYVEDLCTEALDRIKRVLRRKNEI